MKIKMKTGISGLWHAKRGQIVDRPIDEARRLIAAGFADVCEETDPADVDDVKSDPKPVAPGVTTVIHPETAAAPKGKNKGLLGGLLKKN